MKKTTLYIILGLSILINLLFAGRKIYYSNYFKTNPQGIQRSNLEFKKEIFKFSPNDTNEIIFLGNSITSEFLLSEYFRNAKIKNRGVWGDKTSDMLGRMDEIIESKPKMIFIKAGINDLLRNVPHRQIISNYQAIIDKIITENPATLIYIQSILPVSRKASYEFLKNELLANERIIEANNALMGICQDHGIQFINLHSAFVLNGELNAEYSWDGVHINGYGYRLWYNQIYSLVVNGD